MNTPFNNLFSSHKKKSFRDWQKAAREQQDSDIYNQPSWYSGMNKGQNLYDFSGITLEGVDVYKAFAESLNIRNAVIRNVTFEEGDFSRADFTNCHFINTRFNKTIFTDANFDHATFENCNLNRVNLTNANFHVDSIKETVVYGISAWDLKTSPTSKQSKLVIEKTYGFYSDIIAEGRIPMMVDDIELAQFIYYLTNHKKLRETINVMNSRSVLLLGRFKNGGLERLYTIREWLLDRNYLPMIFDFERPDSMDLVEVITTMGGLSKFIIADLSGPFVDTELLNISSIYLKPIIVFHSDKEDKKVHSRHDNAYLHSFIYSGDEKELLQKLKEKVDAIDMSYSHFIQETTERSERKYREG